MEIMTRDFGRIEIEEKDIIEFPEGIPGFKDVKQYVLLPLAEDSPFIVMQAVKKESVAFITLEPANILKNYEFEINDKTEKMLKIDSQKDVVVLNIATIRDKMVNMTVNLAAPLIINLECRKGKQVILDNDRYPIRYQVFAEKAKKVVE